MFGPVFEMSPAFELPPKLYGHHAQHAERILHTFLKRKATTGVLLAGEKGTGKTMVAKLVATKASEMDIPVLLINAPMAGDAFNSLLASFEQPVVCVLDEFEKVYDKDKQQELLTLMDGVFAGQRLFLLTTNDKWKVDLHMINRPGRLYYNLEYEGVETDFVRDYCEDNLKYKPHADGVVLLASLFSEFNFDMLQAIVEEMNRYGEDASQVLKWLNCKMIVSREDRFSIMSLVVEGKRIEKDDLHQHGIWKGNPMTDFIDIVYIDGKDEDGTNNYESCGFSSSDLEQMDVRTGEFIYRNTDGGFLKLRRNKSAPRGLDVANFISKANINETMELARGEREGENSDPEVSFMSQVQAR